MSTHPKLFYAKKLNNQIYIFWAIVSLEYFFTQLYDIKYSYLIQIILPQFYGFKYSYLILTIYTQVTIFNNNYLFACSYMVSNN